MHYNKDNMSKKKSIELLKDIINSNKEFRPTSNDSGWKKLDDKKYLVMSSSKNYEITNKLINLMKKYTNIYKTLTGNAKDDVIKKYDDNIAIIYLLENDKTSSRYIGYTTNPLYIFIKLNLHKHNLDEDNVFDNFDENDLTNFTFEIVEYIKYSNRNDILERKRHYYKKLVKKDKTEEIVDTKMDKRDKLLDKIYDKRMDIFFELLGGQVSKFKSFKGYIYKITNGKKNKSFIGGYHRKLTKKKLLDILFKNKALSEFKRDIKKYGRRNFDLELIDEYDAKTIFDFLLRLDFFKIKNDTIDSGYNQGYSLDESELLFGQRLLTRKKNIVARNLFLKIQKYLFEENYEDNNNYNNLYGFVYQIKHKKNHKRYISYAHINELKKIVTDMYDNAIKGNVKHSKILKAFEEEPYDSFTFKIVKKKKMDDQKIDLEDEANTLIIKYNTIDSGYNLDKKTLRRNIARSRRRKKK